VIHLLFNEVTYFQSKSVLEINKSLCSPCIPSNRLQKITDPIEIKLREIAI